MQHIQLPTVKPILYGSVAALAIFAVAFNDPNIGISVKKCRIKASVKEPVLLEFFSEVVTAFDGTTPSLTVGSVAPYIDFQGTADIAEGVVGFPAVPYKRFRLIADTDIWVKFNVGTQQVETATIVTANVTVAGNAAVTVTGAGISGSPVTLNVPVTTTDTTPALVAAKIVAFMQTDTGAAATAVRALYYVSGGGATIVLTRITPAADDGTLNVAIATGTATGITAAPASANTTAGVLGTAATVGAANIYVRVTYLGPIPTNVLGALG